MLEDEARWSKLDELINNESIKLTMRKLLSRLRDGKLNHHDASRYVPVLAQMFGGVA